MNAKSNYHCLCDARSNEPGFESRAGPWLYIFLNKVYFKAYHVVVFSDRIFFIYIKNDV